MKKYLAETTKDGVGKNKDNNYIIVDADTGEIYTKKQTKSLILKTLKYEHGTEKQISSDGSRKTIHKTIRIVQCIGRQTNLFEEIDSNG